MSAIAKAWLAALCSTAAFGAMFVAPPSQTATAGNATGLGPAVSDDSGILQELIGSGILTSLSSIDITEFSFRASPGTGGVDATFGSVSVYLSYSPNFPNGSPPDMSTTFADNIGADQTLVYSGTNVTLSDAGCAGPGPCPFDLNVSLTTPFFYNAADGSLLLELVFTDLTDTGGSFDDESYASPGGPIGQVISTAGTSATSGSFAYQGSIVELTYSSAVPEPATWIMIAGAIFAFGIFRKSVALTPATSCADTPTHSACKT